MCDDSDSDEFLDAPEVDVPSGATPTVIPEKSRKIYEKVYKRFIEWCETNDTKPFTESGLLAYFTDKSKELKASSLWAEYSIVKSTLAIKHDIDIKHFKKVVRFLKRQAVGYRPNISKAFTRDEIYKFIKEAPDCTFLLMKIVAIIGIAGACKRDELYRITTNCIKECGPLLRIKIPETAETNERSVVVCERQGLNILDLFRKYISLRPNQVEHDHFFLTYRKGMCNCQAVGINTISKVPTLIAKYLELENPADYTGYSFRRSSAALFGDNSTDTVNTRKTSYKKIKSPVIPEPEHIDLSSVLSTLPTSSSFVKECYDLQQKVQEEDEYFHFGRNIACQLRQLPLEEALQCQSEIMNIISQRRLVLLYGKQQVNIKSSPSSNMFASALPQENSY